MSPTRSFVGDNAEAPARVVDPAAKPYERATSVWYRIAALASRRNERDLAVAIIAAEIRSAQYEVWLEAAKMVLSDEPIEIARKLREMAERTTRPTK